MKIRDLSRRAGSATIFAWPPRWEGALQPATPDEGVLESVMRLDNATTLLRLSMRCDARKHTCLLAWDAPPPLAAVESLLDANLGREIRVIGELDI
jgi:hypothetical protein